MKQKLTQLYCWLRGHDWLRCGNFDNEHSQFGSYQCTRCNKHHSWQYDI